MKRIKTDTSRKPGGVRVALYARSASGSAGVEAQLDALRSYVQERCAKGETWVVADTFADEGVPAPKRRESPPPELGRLLDLVEAREVDLVLVTQTSRISRTLSALFDFLKHLKDHGANLISVADGIDFRTPAAQFQTIVYHALRTYELGRRAAAQRAGRRKRRGA